jgi:hypothetical protein
MPAEFKFDGLLKDSFSEPTRKVLTLFPEMLVSQEGILREYHKDTPAVFFERTDRPLDNLKLANRLIVTMYLTKTIYYSRAIIDSVNSRNLLVAFQSMRALIEVVAAVRHTLEKMKPIIHECAIRGTMTADEARQLNFALRGAGFDVKVYERVSGPMETRGAGIVVQGELIDLLRTHGAGALPTTHCTVRRYLSPEGGEGEVQRAPQDLEAIYRTLVAAFPSDRYHRGATLTDFGNGNGAVRAHIDGQGVVEADVLVAADGAQSPTRRRFLPDLSSTYAGYIAWRGTLDEADAPPDLVRAISIARIS